jgi:hypothetical protein
LNTALAREGFEAFYATDRICYLRHIGTGAIAAPAANPYRPLSKDELVRRELLAAFLDKASEDELIQDVLLPLFRQLGFHRVTAAGHKDKALEYGKDIGCATPCRRSMCCISACRPNVTSLTPPA